MKTNLCSPFDDQAKEGLRILVRRCRACRDGNSRTGILQRWHNDSNAAVRIFISAITIAFGANICMADVQPVNEWRGVSPTPHDYDYFGYTVQVDNLGDTILVGIPGRYADTGQAEIFTYNGSSWNWQATLADESQPDAVFGLSAAIREDGNQVAIGAPYEDGPGGATAMGAAYLYSRTGNSWGLTKRLWGHDTGAYDFFGESVAISGNTVVVGADWAWVGAVYPGAVYVFLVAADGTVTEQAKLFSSDGTYDDWFGWSVAIQGDTLVVGAPGDDVGAMDSGSVYVFERTGSSWAQSYKITPEDPAITNYFGDFVAFDGDTIAVGNYRKDGVGANFEQGVVDVYVRDGAAWTKQARLQASDPQPGAWFGFGIDVSGDMIAVGAPFASSSVKSPDFIGETYLFKREGTDWTECARFSPSGMAYADLSGWDVGLCSNRVVTVANAEEVGVFEDAGAMYVYDLVLGSFLSPVIKWIGLTNTDDIAFAFTTEAGALYRVDYRDSLSAGSWMTLFNDIPGTGVDKMIIDPGPLAVTSRFYKVVIP